MQLLFLRYILHYSIDIQVTSIDFHGGSIAKHFFKFSVHDYFEIILELKNI